MILIPAIIFYLQAKNAEQIAQQENKLLQSIVESDNVKKQVLELRKRILTIKDSFILVQQRRDERLASSSSNDLEAELAKLRTRNGQLQLTINRNEKERLQI